MKYLQSAHLPLILLLLFTHCNKRKLVSAGLFENARTYFEDSVRNQGIPVNYRAALARDVQWDLAQEVKFGSSEGILAPILYKAPILMKANFAGDLSFHLDYLTQLLIYRNSSSGYRAVVLTNFPDSNFFRSPQGKFTGLRFVEDWQGNANERLLFSNDGTVKLYSKPDKQAAVTVVNAVCYSINGYNYSPALGESYYWSEPAGCDYYYIESGTVSGSNPGLVGGGGGGNSVGNKAATVTVLPGSSIIKSIKNYFQCFTNVGGSDHSYTVTVCVDQPDPGTRTAWTFTDGGPAGSSNAGNVVNSGHTFLILTENYGSTTITRNVGFYPSTLVWPANPTSVGQFNDDENHSYNISGTFKVDDAQFFNILNYITAANVGSYTYNLNSNNCTTFALNALAQAGINLPRTVGTWPGGVGDDPGDLGEDMRKGNISGMSLNTAPGAVHSNTGQCN